MAAKRREREREREGKTYDLIVTLFSQEHFPAHLLKNSWLSGVGRAEGFSGSASTIGSVPAS